MKPATLADRIAKMLRSPLHVIDRWTHVDIDFDLTEIDLIADLDPGWLDWRTEVTGSTRRVAA